MMLSVSFLTTGINTNPKLLRLVNRTLICFLTIYLRSCFVRYRFADHLIRLVDSTLTTPRGAHKKLCRPHNTISHPTD